MNGTSFEDHASVNLISLLFFGGYLTFANIPKKSVSYTEIRVTNDECQRALLGYLSKITTNNVSSLDSVRESVQRMGIIQKIFNDGRMEDLPLLFDEKMKEMACIIPYDWFARNPEGVLKSHFYLWVLESNLTTHAEVQSGLGESDVEINTQKMNYIIEFKVNTSVNDAIKQAKKFYQGKYTGKPLTIIGVNMNYNSQDNTPMRRHIQSGFEVIRAK